jgi:GNAT superfamily N-acetyltransferase
LRIERARTPRAIRDFAAVVAANWSPPDQAVCRFYEAAIPALLNPDCPLWLYVGYMGGEPVAACELTEGGGVAGLYNVCTLEVHRRRGFAGALVLRSLLDARERGYQTAVLQASEGGRGVYARLGFRATGVYTEYQLPIRGAA